MASTAQSTPLVSVPQAGPQIVPIRPAAGISQSRLLAIVETRKAIEQLKADLEERESEVRSMLEAGATVEAGILRAFLKTTERRNVSWKHVCERELGQGYCARVLAATRPDQFTHLVVEA